MATPPPDDPSMVDSTAVLSSLYQTPLGEFTARRTQLVSQLKRSGHKDVAGRIASAVKPSRSAYLVNQVYWRTRSTYEAVLDAGTAARAAQQARLLGDASTDLAEVIRQRDIAIRSATDTALAVGVAEGQAASEAVATQVRASFEALAAHGLEGRLAHGHLTEDVALPGLAAFAGLVLPAAAAPADPVRRFAVVARRPAAEPVVPEAPPPDPLVIDAESRVEQLRGRRAAVTERLEELRRSVAAAEEVAAAAERAAAQAAKTATDARQAVQRAEAGSKVVEEDVRRVGEELETAEARLRQLTTSEPPSPSGPRKPSRRAKG